MDAALRARNQAEFHASPFYRAHGDELEGWLGTVRTGSPPAQPPPPGDAERLRVIHWNIEQGKAWDRLAEVLRQDPGLRAGDLWTLNEVDWGTARTGNRDVIREVADLLGLHWAIVGNFLELGKGPGSDRDFPGENEIGLHGIGILSRWPMTGLGSAVLPDIFDTFAFAEERRYGRRRVLWGRVEHPRGRFLLATTHLEVRKTPRRRCEQMRSALRALPPDEPCWFAGDWNTHTFRRAGLLSSVLEFIRLQRTSASDLDAALLAPFDREPLLAAVEGAGFLVQPWNDARSTARQVLSGVEELRLLPEALRRRVAARYRLGERTLRLRLDWIASRGPWVPRVERGAAWTRTDLGPEGVAASDHAPIGVDAVWAG